MKRRLIAFLAASALMVATAAPAMAEHRTGHEPKGCEMSGKPSPIEDECNAYDDPE